MDNLNSTIMPLVRYALASAAALSLSAASAPVRLPPRAPGPPPAIAQHVEVLRTAHGVPHIRADNLEAAGYGLGYAMTEDYGARVVLGLLRGRGESAKWWA